MGLPQATLTSAHHDHKSVGCHGHVILGTQYHKPAALSYTHTYIKIKLINKNKFSSGTPIRRHLPALPGKTSVSSISHLVVTHRWDPISRHNTCPYHSNCCHITQSSVRGSYLLYPFLTTGGPLGSMRTMPLSHLLNPLSISTFGPSAPIMTSTVPSGFNPITGLMRDFMVSDIFLPIPSCLVQQIRRWEFIELNQLLPDNLAHYRSRFWRLLQEKGQKESTSHYRHEFLVLRNATLLSHHTCSLPS